MAIAHGMITKFILRDLIATLCEEVGLQTCSEKMGRHSAVLTFDGPPFERQGSEISIYMFILRAE